MKVFSRSKLQEVLSDPKLSLAGIARLIGIDRQSLRAYKLGLREPQSSTLFLIAGALGVPIDYFSENVPDMKIQQQKLPLREERKTRKKNSNQARQGTANA